jgi:predicted O-methyltransferase YrrM
MAYLENDSPLKRFILKCIAPFERKFHFRLYFLNFNECYWAIPRWDQLTDRLWQNGSAMVGVEMNETQQLQRLEDFHRRFGSEFNALPRESTGNPTEYYTSNAMYGSVDGALLYWFIRDTRPKKMVEIGSGMSTMLSATALRKNAEEGHPGELTAIEPDPSPAIKAGFPGLTRLIPSLVQDVPLSLFESLEAGDILFIDSSHVLNIGGDVQYEFLEIIPRLKPGVLVHVHDIFFPVEYPKQLVKEGRFWDEQYLLQAFLAFNNSFEILWAGHFVHCKHPDALSRAISTYDPKSGGPGAFWMRRTR